VAQQVAHTLCGLSLGLLCGGGPPAAVRECHSANEDAPSGPICIHCDPA